MKSQITITPQASAVAPLAPRLEDEAPAGSFAIMAGWKSYEIQHWLDTTTTPNARALFESGAALEAQVAELRAALETMVSLHAGQEHLYGLTESGVRLYRDCCDIAARAALAKVKGGAV